MKQSMQDMNDILWRMSAVTATDSEGSHRRFGHAHETKRADDDSILAWESAENFPMTSSDLKDNFPQKNSSAQLLKSRSHSSRAVHFLYSPRSCALIILVLVCALTLCVTLLAIQSSNIAAFSHASSQKSSHDSSHDSASSESSSEVKKNSHELDTKRVEDSSHSHADKESYPLQDSQASQSQQQTTPEQVHPQISTPPGININTATREELQEIPGVGPVTAQKIIDYRRTHGSFSSVEELTNVSGIGTKTLEKMRSHVRVQ